MELVFLLIKKLIRHIWIFGNWEHRKYTNWDKDWNYPQKEHEYTKLVFYESRIWRNRHPKAKLPFICRPTIETLNGVVNRTWEYNTRDITFSEITKHLHSTAFLGLQCET